jgi:hypothetical protein
MDILRRVDVFRRDRNTHPHDARRSRNELLPTDTLLSAGTHPPRNGKRFEALEERNDIDIVLTRGKQSHRG